VNGACELSADGPAGTCNANSSATIQFFNDSQRSYTAKLYNGNAVVADAPVMTPQQSSQVYTFTVGPGDFHTAFWPYPESERFPDQPSCSFPLSTGACHVHTIHCAN
jgi:hypothetical protein